MIFAVLFVCFIVIVQSTAHCHDLRLVSRVCSLVGIVVGIPVMAHLGKLKSKDEP